jgi:hypothetical protein
MLKGTWQWRGISGFFAVIGSSWVPYTTFRAVFASEIFLFERMTPRYHRYGESPTPHITDTWNRPLPASLIHGVADSPHHRYGESAFEFFKKKTLCNDDTESRRLPAPVIRWVADSPYHWVGESTTPRIVDTESCRLPISLSWRVDDSACRWYGESLFEEKN